MTITPQLKLQGHSFLSLFAVVVVRIQSRPENLTLCFPDILNDCNDVGFNVNDVPLIRETNKD